ncbi:MAG TPA: hypothetical protein VF154_14400 [Terriglobales bacterium]
MTCFHSALAVRLRVISAVILLVGAALFSSYGLVKGTNSSSHRRGSDEVTAYEARFAPARQVLPQYGIVCYVPDYTSSDAAKKDFFLARYALAPLVVRNVPDCDPLIGDFPDGAPASFLSGGQYLVLRDLGHGVLLLKRNGP